MSEQIVLPLQKGARPIIRVTSEFSNTSFYCLIDSGSTLPVWCGSEKSLKLLYPEVIKTGETVLLGGFGTQAQKSEVWKIPIFKLDGYALIKGTKMTYLDLQKLPKTALEFKNLLLLVSKNLLKILSLFCLGECLINQI